MMAGTAQESTGTTNFAPSINTLPLQSKNSPPPFSRTSTAPFSSLKAETTDSRPTEPSKGLKQGPELSFQGPVLTGAAALAEEQHAKDMSTATSTSINPATNIVKALMPDQQQSPSRAAEGSTQLSTRITDTDGTSMPITDEPMQIDQEQTNVSAQSEDVHDPRLLEGNSDGTAALSAPEESHEERSNKAFTYPPRPDQSEHVDAPARGMSLPNATSKSPGSKKHRCHHCGTEFTRHHNLKSHLLTHSQEKPFCCDRCDQKFRRLHDLKRHTKLHTGERPHTCPKCGRAFARGDALARHNKGPGGCAGRRGSGGDEDFDAMNGDESMEGIVYDENGDPHNSKRRKSEQTHSRKRSFQSTVDSSPYRQHSSTYPGPGPLLGAQPQNLANGSSHPHHLSPRMNNGLSQFPSQLNAPQSVFAQGGMTESPKPLSPGAEQNRRLSAALQSPGHARSPSLMQQQQQQSLNRGSDQNGPSVAGMSGAPGQTILPSLGSLTSESQKSSLSSSMKRTPGPESTRPPPSISTSHPLTQPGPNSAGSTNPPSASSQHRSSGGSMREILNHVTPHERPQEFIRKSDADQEIQRVRDEFSARLQQFENMVRTLQEENKNLKASFQGNNPQQVPVTQPETMPASH